MFPNAKTATMLVSLLSPYNKNKEENDKKELNDLRANLWIYSLMWYIARFAVPAD